MGADMLADILYVDRSAWGRTVVTGGDRTRFLHGLSTINIQRLTSGQHGWGALLSPKGRVLATICAQHEDDALVLWTSPQRTEFVRSHLDRHAVMDDVEFTPRVGPAYAVWPSTGAVWDAAMIEGTAPGALTDAAAEEVRRVEAGYVLDGVDVSDENFPFETPLAGLLDYEKGCYIGQEPVFRVHSQGQTARTLRGLRLTSLVGVVVGAPVAHPAKADAGKITSIAMSPRFGAIALAMLHRSATAIGGEISVGGTAGIVAELPLT